MGQDGWDPNFRTLEFNKYPHIWRLRDLVATYILGLISVYMYIYIVSLVAL